MPPYSAKLMFDIDKCTEIVSLFQFLQFVNRIILEDISSNIFLS